jgi:uncharacterized protein YrrD
MPKVTTLEGRDVIGEGGHRLGWIVHVLFSQEDHRMVGFAIERRLFWGVLPRKETFVPIDALRLTKKHSRFAGRRLPGPARSARRYGIDWERTVIFKRMTVRTDDGKRLGMVRDLEVELPGGDLVAIDVSSGMSEDIAVGRTTVEADDILRYEDFALVVTESVDKMESSGGAAAAAGRSTAVAKVAASGAVDKAARVSGRMAGKASKRLKKSLGEWKDVLGGE